MSDPTIDLSPAAAERENTLRADLERIKRITKSETHSAAAAYEKLAKIHTIVERARNVFLPSSKAQWPMQRHSRHQGQGRVR